MAGYLICISAFGGAGYLFGSVARYFPGFRIIAYCGMFWLTLQHGKQVFNIWEPMCLLLWGFTWGVSRPVKENLIAKITRIYTQMK